MKITKERQQAIDILELVENYLKENRAKLLSKNDKKSIINGEDYYTLEDEITNLLKDE